MRIGIPSSVMRRPMPVERPDDEDDEPGRAESEREQEVDGALDRQHRADGTHGRAREWCGCPYSFLDDVRRTLREAPGDPRRRPSARFADRGRRQRRDARDPSRAARGRRQLPGGQGVHVEGQGARAGQRRAQHAEPRPAGRQDRQRGAHGAHGRRPRPG